METIFNKNTRGTKTSSQFISNLHILLLFKNFFSSFFFFPWYVENRAFRNNAIALRIHLLQKIISHLRFDKIVVFFYTTITTISYVGIFCWNFKKTIAISKSIPINFYLIISKKKKYLHLGQKLLYLGIFWLELEKVMIIFEINTLQFVKL